MDTPLIRPVVEPAFVNSPYGTRTDPLTGKEGAWHPGIDYEKEGDPGGAAWPGDRSVLAICNAQVSHVGDKDYNPAERWDLESRHSLGRYIYLTAWIHGTRHYILYAHLNRVDVVVGQNVGQGEVIGEYGTTGASKGEHLHIGSFDDFWKEENIFRILSKGLLASGKELIK